MPRVATPASAPSICDRVFSVTGSFPCDLGAMFSMRLPSGLTIALPTVGLYSVPPLAMAA